MKLKPCPFCGGEARYQKITDTMGDFVFVGYIVKCTKCFAAPLPNNYTGDKKKAAERWNRREPIDRIVEQLEAEEYDVNCNICDYDSEIDTNTLQYYEGKEDGIRSAIEIVKGGAV